MSTLWTFGNSFTFGHGCRPDGPTSEYFHNYKKEGDEIWTIILGEMLNLKVRNFGKCGASNDYIIDSIIDNWDGIKENDYVIIEISFHSRFDVPLFDKTSFSTNCWGFEDLPNFKEEDREKMETIVNFQYYFANTELYKSRYLKRFTFLNKLLRDKKINTYVWDVKSMHYDDKFEKIAHATNNEIEDYHLSFKGNKDFANMIYKKITNQSII